MKYLFFDIECSNCFDGIGKMCEFGYVLTDENFQVIRSGDIPMSPGRSWGSRFNLEGRKHEKDIKLAYDYDYYYEQPEFPHFYDKIKEMVEASDTICFAYSMDNDIPHLYHACIRYRLPPFDYECFDVQKLAAAYRGGEKQPGLPEACRAIVGPGSTIRLQEHLSRDDAEMERMIFEAICILRNTDSKTLLAESSFARTNSVKWMEEVLRKKEQKRIRLLGHELFKAHVAEEEELALPENKGRRYRVSGEVEGHLDELKKAIEVIESRGGLFADGLGNTDFFIVFDEKERDHILSKLKYPMEGKILLYQDFIASSK